MHLPIFSQGDSAQGDVGVQEGLDLLKAYSGISDQRVREKILAWVMDVRAASPSQPEHGSPQYPPDERGLGHTG